MNPASPRNIQQGTLVIWSDFKYIHTGVYIYYIYKKQTLSMVLCFYLAL